jgi:molecular chaperone GrpE
MFRSKKNNNEHQKPENNGQKQAETGDVKPADAGQPMQQEAVEQSQSDKTSLPSLEAEARKEAENRLLRLQADFDNFRKRMIREKNELYVRASEDLMEEMLPVLDHLDLAFQAAIAHKDVSRGTLDGFKLVGEQLKTVLTKFGLTEIAASGKVFDPNLHEAISHIPSEQVAENGVITEARKGYMLGGKLIRAAQVVVSCGKPVPTPDNDVEG